MVNDMVMLEQPAMGQCARKLRESYHKTVADLAVSANCTVQSIYNFESGKTTSVKILQAYLRLPGGEYNGINN